MTEKISPTPQRLVSLDDVLAIINEPGDLMWPTAQEWLTDKLNALGTQSESKERFIRCVWVVEREFGYGKAMRVVDSDHPRFSVGTRFDFGFLDIAVSEGYRVQIEPVPPFVKHDMGGGPP